MLSSGTTGNLAIMFSSFSRPTALAGVAGVGAFLVVSWGLLEQHRRQNLLNRRRVLGDGWGRAGSFLGH